ncbi:hypothetical protein HDV62DRAFT_61696 [Trichoderma sp. SZMC 28011]
MQTLQDAALVSSAMRLLYKRLYKRLMRRTEHQMITISRMPPYCSAWMHRLLRHVGTQLPAAVGAVYLFGLVLRVPAHSIILASNFTRIDNLVSRRSGGLEIPALWSSGVLGISKLAGSSPVGRLAADPTEQQASPAPAEWIRVGIMVNRENCLSIAVYRQNHAQDSRGSGESL